MKKYILITFLMLLFTSEALYSNCTLSTVYVNLNATSGNQNGSSWTDAFLHLQDAIDFIVTNDCPATTQIWVTQGTYTPTKNKEGIVTTDQDRTFYLNRDVKIYGGFTGSETMLSERQQNAMEQTILSGDFDGDDTWAGSNPFPKVDVIINGDNAYTVLWIEQVSDDFVLDGFTIMAGENDGALTDWRGGGIYNDGSGANGKSTPMIVNCWILGNYAERYGAGIFNDGRMGGDASMYISNCNFFDNSSRVLGGAIFNDGEDGKASPTVSNTLFEKNGAQIGAAIRNLGINGEASGIYTKCRFIDHKASSDGGAIANDGAYGMTNPIFINCLFAKNRADGRGGVIINSTHPNGGQSRSEFHFCTLADNEATNGEAIYNSYANFEAHNSIIWGGSGIQIIDVGIADPPIVENTIIQDGYLLAPSAIDQNPLFINPATCDFRLQLCSPAIDVSSSPNNPPTDDLLGNSRPINAIYDLGAYEYDGTVTENAIYVNLNATSGNQDGSSWTDAFLHLQDAIDFVVTNNCPATTEIWVAQGTYTPTKNKNGITTTDRDRTFYLNRDMKIYGGFTGSETMLSGRQQSAMEQTILSGDFDGDDTWAGSNPFPKVDVIINSDNAYTVLWIEQVSSDFVLDGFTIMAGENDGALTDWRGGGIYNDGSGTNGESTPIIANCWFVGNYAERYGAGIFNDGRMGGDASMTISNCNFYNNTSRVFGGAIFNDGENGKASLAVSNTLFEKNGASIGAAIRNLGNDGEASGTYTNCEFISNGASTDGGAIANAGAFGISSPSFTNCLFAKNRTTNGRGGVMINSTHPNGGQSSPILRFCTLADNEALNGVIYNSYASFEAYNSILWGNTGINIIDFGTADIPVIENTIIENGYSSAPNALNEDPLFFAPEICDFSLQSCSPAIDVNSSSINPPPNDLLGNSRLVNNIYDLGAYEYPEAKFSTADLATTNQSMNKIQTETTAYSDECSDLIATVTQSGLNPIVGEVAVSVWIEITVPNFNGTPYLARHYEITPTMNAASSTGKVTLYFEQTEFDDFNNTAGSTLGLPTSANDAAGKSNLRITKIGSTSSDGTGLPASYGGSSILLDPIDEDIVWNADLSRWEVSFEVDGFSGFFVQTDNLPLPVELLSFEVKAVNEQVRLDWITASEKNNAGFYIERAVKNDLNNWEEISFVKGNGTSLQKQSYTLWDENPHLGINYYRLRQVDFDGNFEYSEIRAVNFDKSFKEVRVYPNPTNQLLHIDLPIQHKFETIRLYNSVGQLLRTVNIQSEIVELELSDLTNGFYNIQLGAENGQIHFKTFVKQ